MTEETDGLRQVPFFEDLTPEDLDRVAQIGERRSYGEGEVIVSKEGQGQELFVIMAGRADVEAGGRTHELGPGSFFGEMALLGRKPRSATVTAREPVEALVLEAMYFKPFLIKNPSVAVAILEGVVERLREVQERVESSQEAGG
jgi:CRP-like cAMP-binding protein